MRTADSGSDSADTRFLHAIVLGASIGVPVLWVSLTLAFAAITDAGWTAVAGFSALPAVFCGPFLGGLFTTAYATRHAEGPPAALDPVRVVEDALHDTGQRTAA